MRNVLVTGANGQLGESIRKIASDYIGLEFAFKTFEDLDITDASMVKKIFKQEQYDYCVNCAAYTDVERAENQEKRAFLINAEGVRNIAQSCVANNVALIHISTDYVFDGEKKEPYTIIDEPNPINVYGASKAKGEAYVQKIVDAYFIIRTSWLYSEFGQNFYKMILEKAKTEKSLFVTDAQTGCPTRAAGLAKYILELIKSDSKNYGIHHFTDGEPMTWYDFARKILLENGLTESTHLEKAKNYRTLARRPKNSVLSCGAN